MRDLYFCPTAGEVESAAHGGFDVCCSRPDLHRAPTAAELDGIIGAPSRVFFPRSWDSSWWRPLILTIGLRVPGGALLLALNVPLCREPCDGCRQLGGPS